VGVGVGANIAGLEMAMQREINVANHSNAEDEDIDGICDAATTITDPGIVDARSVITSACAHEEVRDRRKADFSSRDKHTEKVIRLVAALVKLDNEVRLHHPDLNRRLLQAACDAGELKVALHLL
jgi:hypothetical protein